MRVAIYDLTTGQIAQISVVLDIQNMLDAIDQTKQGALQVADNIDDVNSYINVSVTPPVARGIPGRPAVNPGDYTFNWTTHTWQNLINVNRFKVTYVQGLDAQRRAANQSSFTFAGKQIACDANSRSDIQDVTQTVQLTGSLPASMNNVWPATDGTTVAVPDVATWKQLVLAMFALAPANQAKFLALVAQVKAAANVTQVRAVVWS